jgi:hypothetical protein
MLESQIRLFLSVDISGSTKLKNLKNYIKMINRSEDLGKICAEIQKLNTGVTIEESIKYVLLQNEDLDWVNTISNTFSDFHSLFLSELKRSDLFPWKVLGDELIYSLRTDDREELQTILLAFYKTLRKYDKNLREKNSIRLKGSAWTAGFPIRNRIIQIPCPNLYYKDGNGVEKNYQYPKEDYLGPEMDIGFRLGKCVSSGFIVISLELAFLLSEVESSNQFNIVDVGWEPLKGVWGDRPYPIYWLYLPNNDKDNDLYKYNEYCDWETASDHLLYEWDKNKEEMAEAKALTPTIKSIISKLPTELGVEVPYFTKSGIIPKKHQEILKLLKDIELFMEKSEIQNPAKTDNTDHSEEVTKAIKQVNNIINPNKQR